MTSTDAAARSASKRARYIALETVQNVSLLPTLLGTVVSMTTRPTRSYRPVLKDDDLSKNEQQELKALMEGLLEDKNGVVLHDIKVTLAQSSDKATELQLFNLFSGRFKGVAKNDIKLSSGTAKRYTLDNVGSVLRDKLNKSKPYKAQVKKILQDLNTDKLPMITGILTCKDIEVSWSNTQQMNGNLDVKVPANEMAGSPDLASINPRIKIDVQKSNESTTFARIEDEVIFAIAYDYILYGKEPVDDSTSLLARFWKKLSIWCRNDGGDDFNIKSMKLGREARGQGVNVNFGQAPTTRLELPDIKKAGMGDDSSDTCSDNFNTGGDYVISYYETEYEDVHEVEATTRVQQDV
jgi:hypothetical protein